MFSKTFLWIVLLTFAIPTNTEATLIYFDVSGYAHSNSGTETTLTGFVTIDSPFLNADGTINTNYLPPDYSCYGALQITSFNIQIGNTYTWSGTGSLGYETFHYNQAPIFSGYWKIMQGFLLDRQTNTITDLGLAGSSFGHVDRFGSRQYIFENVSELALPYAINFSLDSYQLSPFNSFDLTFTRSAPVPEPCTILLVSLGLAIVGLAKKRFHLPKDCTPTTG